MAEKKRSGVLPKFGMAAAAFAAFLVIVTLPQPAAALQTATKFFAVCIPLVIASAVLRQFVDAAKQKIVKAVLDSLHLVVTSAGDIGCGIGIYWVFRNVSEGSAQLFLSASLISWVVVGLIGLAVERFAQKG